MGLEDARKGEKVDKAGAVSAGCPWIYVLGFFGFASCENGGIPTLEIWRFFNGKINHGFAESVSWWEIHRTWGILENDSVYFWGVQADRNEGGEMG